MKLDDIFAIGGKRKVGVGRPDIKIMPLRVITDFGIYTVKIHLVFISQGADECAHFLHCFPVFGNELCRSAVTVEN